MEVLSSQKNTVFRIPTFGNILFSIKVYPLKNITYFYLKLPPLYSNTTTTSTTTRWSNPEPPQCIFNHH